MPRVGPVETTAAHPLHSPVPDLLTLNLCRSRQAFTKTRALQRLHELLSEIRFAHSPFVGKAALAPFPQSRSFSLLGSPPPANLCPPAWAAPGRQAQCREHRTRCFSSVKHPPRAETPPHISCPRRSAER